MKKYLMLVTLAFVSALLLGCTEKETQVEVSSVSLNTATIEMVEGETFSLVATVLPKDAEYDGVTWASSSASVASVNSGTVTAIKEGTATITASAGGKSATCTVKVSAKIIAVTSVSLNKTSLLMQVGDTETLTATVKPDDATDKNVTWSSSDEFVAKVDNGKVTAINAGQAKITVAVGNITTSSDVVVYRPDNVIIYTTTDKKVLKPYNEDAFGSAIVSNTYVDDVGIINFEKPVTFIGNMAFWGQSNLKSIIIPNTVSAIGKKSFYKCNDLLSVNLPQSLTLIDDDAFYFCYSMKDLTLPDNVLKIGKYAFYSCIRAFYNNNNTLVLPKKLQTISGSAFRSCRLRNIIWNEDLTYIGEWAFGENEFEEITIPGSISTLSYGCFANCQLLKKVELQEGVTDIVGDYFYYCSSLSKIILPSTLKRLDFVSFEGCILLKDVYSKAKVPPVMDSSSLENADLNQLSIWVPRESVDAYKSSGWGKYKDNIKGYDF